MTSYPDCSQFRDQNILRTRLWTEIDPLDSSLLRINIAEFLCVIKDSDWIPSRIIFRARVAQGSFGVHLAPARVGDILRDRELSSDRDSGSWHFDLKMLAYAAGQEQISKKITLTRVWFLIIMHKLGRDGADWLAIGRSVAPLIVWRTAASTGTGTGTVPGTVTVLSIYLLRSKFDGEVLTILVSNGFNW